MTMTNHERAKYGRRAIEAGSPDLADNDLATNASDTIANVLHAAAEKLPPHEIAGIVGRASRDFRAEEEGDE